MTNTRKAPAILLMLMLWARMAVAPAHAADRPAGDDAPATNSAQSGLKADPRDNPFYVAPPLEMVAPGPMPRQVDALRFEVNYNDPASCPDTLKDYPDSERVDWTPDMIQAFDYATQIWSTVLNGGIPVVIHACLYDELEDDPLGYARSRIWYADFPGAGQQDTYYPAALANQLANSDLNGAGAPEIVATLNAEYSWYFGIDGKVPEGQFDFVSVVLHEIGHGLGFSGSANYDDGTTVLIDGKPVDECTGTAGVGCLSTPPRIYDRFVEDGLTKLVGGFVNPSSGLGSALTGGALNFNGPAANGGTQYSPVLYAPGEWDSGSSYVHLDETVYEKTVDALMTPSIGFREAIHHPGPVMLGIFADQGWFVNSRMEVYVDRSNLGFEDGTAVNPFSSVREGTQAVLNGGTVWIRPGNYNEKLTLSRPMILKGATATIGK